MGCGPPPPRRGSSPCRWGIVPPELLRRIAQNGTPPQREAALATLAADHSLRFARATSQLMGGGQRFALTAPEFARRRTIFDAGHRETLPGKPVRVEGQRASRDAEVNEAYAGLGTTFDFFATVYDRNSIDDAGMPLDASVHYGVRYDNAFWNGRQMVFGDGDGELFNRFTASLDVIAHELTHGITADEANLVYLGQAGALNESISDVFGSLVEQYRQGESAAEADWLIGKGLFTRRVKGVALRSLKAPGSAFDDPVLGKDDQPATMAGYVHTTADNGGVHTNSGIPNHAFYLVARALGGKAWEVAGRIWYETLRDRRLRPNATFRAFAALTARNAGRSFGDAEERAVALAWRQVGVDPGIAAGR